MERTDKELIDWLEANAHGVDHSTGRGEPWVVWTSNRDGLRFRQAGGDTWREAVNAAMSTSEAGEMEEAWKWFREEASTGRLDLVCVGRGSEWHVGIATSIQEKIGIGPTANAALLNAYRALKGK